MEPTDETGGPADVPADAPPKPSGPPTFKLTQPVQWLKDEPPVEELVIKLSARAFREFSLPMNPETGMILYQPYACAVVGAKMAGYPAGAAFVDKMSPKDINALGQLVMSFLS